MKFSDWIIEETNDWIVINKPSGLLSIPDREGKEISLKTLLKERYGEIFTVHRLDKETSGLILFAKNDKTHKYLSLQLGSMDVSKKTSPMLEGTKAARKIYQGLVTGSLMKKSGMINSPIAEHPSQNGIMIIHRKGKESITEYEVLEDFGSYSFVQFQLHTGRTHQIRLHMKDIGHPIVCDKLYGDGKPLFVSSLKINFKLSKNEEAERPILNRLALHALQLSFTDPLGKLSEMEAPLPKDMRATLQQLLKRKKGG